jgi:hypothetical protein
VSFRSPEWGGQNTYQARVDGARILSDAVIAAVKEKRVPILVGHSHGGSVIAHALAHDEALCEQIGGAIFMATPFIQARPLPLGSHLPKGPALLAGLLCALVVVLGGLSVLVAAGWPEDRTQVLDAAAFILPYAGLLAWWGTFRAVARFLGSDGGRTSERTHARLAELVGQLDLTTLEARGVNRKALLLRSSADEAASGLAAAQLLGRIASDLPSLIWKLPRAGGEWLRQRMGLNRPVLPWWIQWSLLTLILAVALGWAIRGAAWISDWPALLAVDAQIRGGGSALFETLFTAFVWVASGIVFLLLMSVPLVVVGIPLKLLGLWLYGLRGWPVLQALYVELSVEPAPAGEWRVHQLDAKDYESEVERARLEALQADLGATLAGGDTAAVKEALRQALASDKNKPRDTALAHSFVYNDPRAHRAIAKWLVELQGPPVAAHRTRAT